MYTVTYPCGKRLVVAFLDECGIPGVLPVLALKDVHAVFGVLTVLAFGNVHIFGNVRQFQCTCLTWPWHVCAAGCHVAQFGHCRILQTATCKFWLLHGSCTCPSLAFAVLLSSLLAIGPRNDCCIVNVVVVMLQSVLLLALSFAIVDVVDSHQWTMLVVACAILRACRDQPLLPLS